MKVRPEVGEGKHDREELDSQAGNKGASLGVVLTAHGLQLT